MEKDFFEKFYKPYERFVKECRGKGIYNDLPVVEGESQGPEVKIKGFEKNLINCDTLDYLNLGITSLVKEHLGGLVENLGTGFGISRAVADHEIYLLFEKEMARFKRAGSFKEVKLFNTGYQACYNTIMLLAGNISAAGIRMKEEMAPACFFMDIHAHASLQDAVRNNGFKCETIAHLNYDRLEKKIEKTDSDWRKIIVVDALYSMNGSLADCNKLLEIAKKYDAIIILDNAHSDGVYGTGGRGILDHQGIKEAEDLKYFVEVSTLSKAFSTFAGYSVLPWGLCDLTKVCNFHYIFSVPVPPALIGLSIVIKKIIEGEKGNERRKKLHRNTAKFREEMRAREFNLLNSASQIVPVVIGDDVKCQLVRDFLLEEGILVGAIRSPAVSRRNALLRFSLTAGIEDYHYEKIIQSLEKARNKFNF